MEQTEGLTDRHQTDSSAMDGDRVTRRVIVHRGTITESFEVRAVFDYTELLHGTQLQRLRCNAILSSPSCATSVMIFTAGFGQSTAKRRRSPAAGKSNRSNLHSLKSEVGRY